ncbi:hypothetical protein V5O48_019364, partial [Marasmius crinis-equi]
IAEDQRVQAGGKLHDFLFENGAKVADSKNRELYRFMWNFALLEVLVLLNKTGEERNALLESRAFSRSKFINVKPINGLYPLKNWPGIIGNLKGYLEKGKQKCESPPAPKPVENNGVLSQLELILWHDAIYKDHSEDAKLSAILESVSSLVLYISLFRFVSGHSCS